MCPSKKCHTVQPLVPRTTLTQVREMSKLYLATLSLWPWFYSPIAVFIHAFQCPSD